MKISVSEKANWVSDLICRELQRFVEDTGACVEDVRLSKLDGQITSVSLGMSRGEQDD